MGWPNNDPEGWAEVERSTVLTWLHSELAKFRYPEQEYTWPGVLTDMIEMLQSEHNDVFQVLLGVTPVTGITDAEADYLERKFSTEEKP